ncbi:hypothetical protein B7463_g9035, partial [Scytalidium lignicola]
MYESTDQGRDGAITDSDMPRRALRKGTRSCVECKRRKTRCFFDQTSAAVCVGCQRRGSICIGQEFVDVPIPSPNEDPAMAERLRRVEQMLEEITNGLGHRQNRSDSQSLPPQDMIEDQIVVEGGHVANDDENHILINGYVTDTTKTTLDNYVVTPPWTKYEDTCRALYTALPSPQDADSLFAAGRASIFLQALCNPYSELFVQGDFQSSSTLSVLPTPTAHPVILARKLLQLSLCIQQLDPSFDQTVLGLGLCPRDAMKKYFNVATSMVTCHDELLDSLEGLECLVYEGVYLVNAGNLRRALASLRRASTLAQFMGLHRKASYRALKQHDPETHISCDVTWAHIAYLERYLSLLLGIPTSITRTRFASEEKSAEETHSEWLEKVQIDICEHIIERNHGGDDDFTMTQKIDETLNKVASSIPAKWWTPIDLHKGMDGNEVMLKVISMQMQIVHYNLLTVLHLPFVLRDMPDYRFDYNKTTCTYASREVLSRFITFRSVVRIVFCCRIVDFCAFTAAMTLLLAHLNGHRQNSGHLLTHQRQGDRALIEKTIETLDGLNQLNNDELSRETAKLARKLLDLEADIVQGGDKYSCSVAGEPPDDNGEGDGQRSFYLNIPYFGTIRIAREVSFSSRPLPGDAYVSPQTGNSCSTSTSAFNTTSSSFSPEQHFTSSHIAIGDPPGPLSEHALQLMQVPQHLPVGGEQLPFLMYRQITAYQDKEGNPYGIQMPDLMAGADDWAFQGVDTAFFDTLISGNTSNPVGWDGACYKAPAAQLQGYTEPKNNRARIQLEPSVANVPVSMVGVAGRSKGCNTCRQRHVKCDEVKPICQRCIKAGFECLGYSRETQWFHTIVAPFPQRQPSSTETATSSTVLTNDRRMQQQQSGRRIIPAVIPARLEIPQQMSLVAFQSDFCFAYIFSNFVWRGYGSLWLERAAEGKLGPVALDAAKALAQSTFGRSKKVADVEIQGGIHYSKSLQALAKELGNTQALLLEGEACKLVVPILVLMMHASTLTDRMAATFHLQGVTKIINLCGPEAFQRQPLLNALEAARATLVVASLVTRKRVFFDTPQWRSVPWALNPMEKTPQSYLLDILASVPGILEEMNNHLQPSDNSPSSSLNTTFHSTQKAPSTTSGSEVRVSVAEDPFLIPTTPDKSLHSSIIMRVIHQLRALYRWRWHWEAHFGTDVDVDKDLTHQGNGTMQIKLGPTGSLRPLDRLHFKHFGTAADIMLYNSVLMWLLALVWELDPLRAGDLIEQCASNAMEHVMWNRNEDTVLDMEFKFGESSVSISRYTSFEPLRCPGALVSVRDPAMEICRVFEWQSRNHGASREANFMYMFPICMAMSVLDTDVEGQSWIQALLDANPLTKGFGGYSGPRMSRGGISTTNRTLDQNSNGRYVKKFGQFVTREILDAEKEFNDTSPGLVHLLLLRGKMDIA